MGAIARRVTHSGVAEWPTPPSDAEASAVLARTTLRAVILAQLLVASVPSPPLFANALIVDTKAVPTGLVAAQNAAIVHNIGRGALALTRTAWPRRVASSVPRAVSNTNELIASITVEAGVACTRAVLGIALPMRRAVAGTQHEVAVGAIEAIFAGANAILTCAVPVAGWVTLPLSTSQSIPSGITQASAIETAAMATAALHADLLQAV